MKQIKPFYELLHGVLRRVLWKRVHTFEPFDQDGTLPAHLLGKIKAPNFNQWQCGQKHFSPFFSGSMWSQNWQLYEKLLLPLGDVNLDAQMNHLNWSSVDMVKRADDFYRSLSLPAMTKEFWTRSIFDKSADSVKCHGTAANMFQTNDFRFAIAFFRNDLVPNSHIFLLEE